jgi:NADPH:quinone reductase-like Zn-dependent oxidoreductase
MSKTMKAMVISKYGGPEVLQPRTVPLPAVTPGHVVVRVRAFGLNHAEAYFRKGAWGEVAKISGIECVGEVEDPGDTSLSVGQHVFALMGGMGRTIDGSYAEYTRVPAAHVIPIQSSLDWSSLAALPESYATAWVFFRHNLKLAAGQTLLVRGGTSALGQAAINLARLESVRVLATTRSREKFPLLEALGAEPLVDTPELSKTLAGKIEVDAVLEIVGNRTLLDSLRVPRYGGRVAMAGFLGGGEPLNGFDPLMHLPSGIELSFFASAFLFGTPAVPMNSIPFQLFVDAVEKGAIVARPAHAFPFERLVKAHELMESGDARGKIVIDVAA